MAPKNTQSKRTIKNDVKKARESKPILIKVGNHLISPTDIRCISAVKKGKLYIIKFYSEPNPEFPCFVEPHDIGIILNYFNIIESD